MCASKRLLLKDLHPNRGGVLDVLGEIREGVVNNVETILSHFRAATQEDPWIRLPQEYHANNLHTVVVAVAELALRPSEGAPERCRSMLHAAAEHGEERLREGFDDSLLFRELYLLRTAIWHYVHQHPAGSSAEGFEAILRIDGALTLAVRASVRGFHRPTYETRGEWPHVIDGMECEWNARP